MEYIGFESIPAPVLKDIKNPKEPINLMNELLSFIKKLYQKAKLVHGDLSEFNILYHNQKPVIIDISQAISFEKLGIDTPDPEDFYYEVINIDK
jgi:serine/threonine-protein kinase RIO1